MRTTRRSLLAGAVAASIVSPARALATLEPYRGDTPSPRDLDVLSLGSQLDRASTNGTPGKLVVVNFFATWCTPCMVEMPALNVLAERGLPWLEVIAIAYGQNEFVLKQAFRSRKMSETVRKLSAGRREREGWAGKRCQPRILSIEAW